MRLRGEAGASWRLLLFVLLSWTSVSVLAKDKTPKISVSEFAHPPLGLNYFEDSDVVLFHDVAEANVYRSDDAGASWGKVDGIPEGAAGVLVMHQFHKERAYVLTEGKEQYKTEDRGKTWSKFDSGALTSPSRRDVIHFHADDPDRLIFQGMICEGILCFDVVQYTLSNFAETGKTLHESASGCWWAKSSELFTTGQDDLDKNRVLCIAADAFSLFKQDQRLLASDNFFKDSVEPSLDNGYRVQGVVNLAIVKKYLLVATVSLDTDEMSLFVTDNTINWHRAMFPQAHGHKINQGAYTVLEGTNYSIQVDVMNTRPSNPMGVMFTSNSNGTFFTENLEHTNRDESGSVDFEKISGIQGIFLVNTVSNGEEVENSGNAVKEITTRITFDDGREFHDIKAGDETLHLHSVTDLDNLGRIFSSPAPGLVMGNGNTGKSLGAFGESNLFVSDNAGVTWKKALDGPHKYEFGDKGSLLVAVKDSNKPDVGEVRYSLDHGENWETVSLPDDLKIKPEILTTTQDSTSLKFILVGSSGDNQKFHVVALNFGGLQERTCGDGDMEEWHARVDSDGNPTCLMGHKQTFTRRKKDADCFLNQEFKDPVPQTEDCECTDEDFECDYNFVRTEDGKCEKAGPIVAPDGECEGASPDDTFKGSSGWRLIPGNTCKRTGGEQKDDPVERKCGDIINSPVPPASGNITRTPHVFKDLKNKEFEKVYLERGESNTDSAEAIIARAYQWEGGGAKVEPKIYRTLDHGKSWDTILDDKHVVGVHPHPFFKEVVFFTTDSEEVWYTVDRTENVHSFKAPSKFAPGHNPLTFHPDQKDWLLWVGESCDEVDGSNNCQTVASLSRDRGDNWRTILRNVNKCEFTGHSANKLRDLRQIVCIARDNESKDSPKYIISSNDFFEEDKQKHDSNVKDFATMAEFIVVAAEEKEQQGLRALASMDGETYAEAHFPYNFQVDHQNAYTVLDSSTHAVNLFVATEMEQGQRYGSIIKSNSNGTSYVMSHPKVNCNDDFFVDFEKIPGLEGVVLVNQLAELKDGKKTLQTQISHNDGSLWAYLTPPAKDVEGKSYSCSGKGDKNCALHLHHYTERADKKKTFSASSAVGLMFGYGNVGSSLGSVEEADTFMTTNGGIDWVNVKKGAWMWQFGDQGSIIVLAKRSTTDNVVKTNTVAYSTDEGNTWNDYPFSETEVIVTDITSVRSGSSRNFLLWCKAEDGQMSTVNLDFSGLTDRACEPPEPNEGENQDYTVWSPRHPMQENECLFGHQTQYIRKRPDAQCYNSRRLEHIYQMKNCTCTREDFECDFNYELDNNGQCKLVEGKEPKTAEQWCKENPDAVTYWEPTGYRRIPLTTCQGGAEFDKTSTPHPCAGKEKEFEREHRTSGVAIFFAVIIPLAIAGGIGWWVWTNWAGKFGQIRLGETGNTFDSDQPWVKYPIIAISAVGAVVATLPLVAGALWRSATSAYERVGGGSGGSWLNRGPRRFTTRDSFARGRGDYSSVADDEGELLGDDSDDDV